MNGKQIKELRELLNMNQQKFSDRIGVGWGCISRWENGASCPSPMAMKALLQLRDETLQRQTQRDKDDGEY